MPPPIPQLAPSPADTLSVFTPAVQPPIPQPPPPKRKSHVALCIGGIVSFVLGLIGTLVLAWAFIRHDGGVVGLLYDLGFFLVSVIMLGVAWGGGGIFNLVCMFMLMNVGIGLLVAFFRARRADSDGTVLPKRSRIAAALLGIFLGGTGAHSFYTGIRRWSGFVHLPLAWLAMSWLVGACAGFRYLFESDAEFAERLSPTIKPLTSRGRLWIACVAIAGVAISLTLPILMIVAEDARSERSERHTSFEDSTGAVVIKGFWLGMTFAEARAAFEKHGWTPELGRGNLVYRGEFGNAHVVAEFDNHGQLHSLYFQAAEVDKLFNSADLNARDFAQLFLNSYLAGGVQFELREGRVKPYWYCTDPRGFTVTIADDKRITWTRVPSAKERKFGG